MSQITLFNFQVSYQIPSPNNQILIAVSYLNLPIQQSTNTKIPSELCILYHYL